MSAVRVLGREIPPELLARPRVAKPTADHQAARCAALRAVESRRRADRDAVVSLSEHNPEEMLT